MLNVTKFGSIACLNNGTFIEALTVCNYDNAEFNSGL